MLLRSNGPINLSHTLESGQVFRWRRNENGYRGVVGGDVWTVRPAMDGIEFDSFPRRPEDLALEARAYFRLDDDLSAIYASIQHDARIAHEIKRYRGLRLIQQDPWECLVSFIISAYSNIPRIASNVEQISASFGGQILEGSDDYHAFPTVPDLAKVNEAGFRRLGLGYRSKFLARLGSYIMGRRLDLMQLRTLPYLDAKAELLNIFGVGEKVADCVLAFSLGKLEAFPIDVHVRRNLLDWYFPGVKMTDRELRVWAFKYFGQFGGYAQQYLFHGQRLGGGGTKVR